VKSTLGLMIALLAVACTNSKTPKMPFRALGENVVVEETRSDESIGTDVRRQLDLAGPADTAALVVEVDGGAVTLRGAAPSLAAAWRAESAARAVKGVKSVVNQIQVPGQRILP
jgi:osmotically-inducible protein OsmY